MGIDNIGICSGIVILMEQLIGDKISVISVYNRTKNIFSPVKIDWQGRIYIIKKIGYHHQLKIGGTLHHVFTVTDGNTDFRLDFDSEMLSWTLEEVSDGLAS